MKIRFYSRIKPAIQLMMTIIMIYITHVKKILLRSVPVTMCILLWGYKFTFFVGCQVKIDELKILKKFFLVCEQLTSAG
jgi:hypothetical protein